MKSKKILVASALLALFASTGAFARVKYICHSEGMSGFYKEYGQWKPVIFNNQLVVTVTEYGKPGSGDYTINSEPALFTGGVPDAGFSQKTMINASESGYSRFTMDKESLRFSLSQMRGYVHDGDGFTPVMAVGKCRRI